MRGASRRGEWHSTRFRWLSLREELRKGEAARENVVETAGSGPEVLYLSIYHTYLQLSGKPCPPTRNLL